MLKKIIQLLDSPPVVVFFAAWTGYYLAQIFYKGTSPLREGWWIIAGLLVGLVILNPKTVKLA